MNALFDRLVQLVFHLLKREERTLAHDIAIDEALILRYQQKRESRIRLRRQLRESRAMRHELEVRIAECESRLRSASEYYNSAERNEPPRAAEMIVGALTKKRYRGALLADLDEEFHRGLSSGMSVKRARMRYWAAALNSIGPQLWAAARRIGLLGILADYARRLLH